ncbi:MAG: AAA family ATPase [Ktedonobacterales bacterium]
MSSARAATTTVFSSLLRRYRKAAGLTQEELAAAAGLSARAISDLERGLRTNPHRDTVQMLADALQLTEPHRAELSASARRATQPATVSPPPTANVGDDHHLLAPVGRQRELAQIERLLARDGPPVLLLSGEPGIGKTRLLQEASQRAALSGWSVLEGGCQRRSGQMPFSPVSEAVERYLRALPLAQRRERLRGCDWLVRLLPELEVWGLQASTGWTLAPEQERRLLFLALGRLLENSAGPAGALLVLDDLQWAGSDTLGLVMTLIQSSATSATLRLIGAYRGTEVRPHDALGMLVADLLRQGLLDHAELAPLAERDAATLLERLIGSSAGAALATDIIRRTGGVPYFLTSYAASLRGASNHQAHASGEPPPARVANVPWTITESVRQRVAALPRAGQALLGVVAVAGRFIDRELLFATAQRFAYAAADTLDGVEAACHAHLLSERGAEGYQFTHDLIRETILGDLSAARKALLHQQIGEELETRSTRRRDLAAELAWHFGASGDSERALKYALEAGDLAAAVFARAEAERRYHDALVLARKQGDAKREAESLEKLGGELCTLGRYDDALDTLRLAKRAYRTLADSEGQARTAILAANVLGNRAATEEGIEWLESVLESPTEAQISQGAKGAVLASLSMLYITCARYVEALTTAERALELGRSLGDTRLTGFGYERLANALFMLGRPIEAYQANTEALQLLEEAGDVATLSRALGELADSGIVAGRLDDATRHFERAVEYATQVGEPVQLAWLHIQMSEREFYSGRWDHMRAELETARDLLGSLDAKWYTPYVDLQVGLMDLVQGRRAAGLATIQRAITYEEPMRDLQILRLAQRWAAESDLAAGDPISARARLDPLVADVPQRESDITGLLPYLAWACAETGETARAEELTRLAVERAERDQFPFVLVDGLRIQALLAIRRGAWQEATAALDGSLRRCRALPCPWAEAQALYVYGLLHALRGEPDAARDRFTAAVSICDRLGEGMYRPIIETALAALPPPVA